MAEKCVTRCYTITDIINTFQIEIEASYIYEEPIYQVRRRTINQSNSSNSNVSIQSDHGDFFARISLRARAARVHFNSRKALSLRQRILPRYCVFKNAKFTCLTRRSIFVGFCSGKKQCFSQAIYFHISNF